MLETYGRQVHGNWILHTIGNCLTKVLQSLFLKKKKLFFVKKVGDNYTFCMGSYISGLTSMIRVFHCMGVMFKRCIHERRKGRMLTSTSSIYQHAIELILATTVKKSSPYELRIPIFELHTK